MLKQIAWNTFKNTGNINTMLELIQVDEAAKEVTKEIPKEVAKDDNKKSVILKKEKGQRWEL